MNDTHINKCSGSIENCDECDNKEFCSKCKNDFYMINDLKTTCLHVSDISINNYYLNIDKTMYYSCDNSLYQDVQNCKECTSKQICTFCHDMYTFINGDKSTCIKKETLTNKYIQDNLDNSNYIKCENKFSNCDSCNTERCLTCKDEYIFINDDFLKCILKSSINLEFYFTHDNITYYSCKEEIYQSKKECQILNIETTEIEQTSKLSTTNINSMADSSVNNEDNPIDIPSNNPLIVIFFLQVQIINNLLKIF